MDTAAITRIDFQTVSQFLNMEAKLLDDRKFSEWMDLFTDDGFYWVPCGTIKRTLMKLRCFTIPRIS